MGTYKYIVIEGNIGSGKSTLSKKLASTLDANIILETFSENPFLPKFYKDQKRFALPLELSFLTERFHQQKDELDAYKSSDKLIIADYYFSKSLLFAKITLPKDEFELYNNLFDIIYCNLPKPDLYIFLNTDIDRLVQNIAKRGREYEKDISSDYLSQIRNEYLNFLNQQSEFPILLIDNTHIDFVKNEYEFEAIEKLIKKTWTNGLHKIEF